MAEFNLEATIERMKAEIRSDMASGVVPRTVEDFSELHNYVDANCYGGFCDEKELNGLWAQFGAGPEDGCPEEVYVFTCAAQEAINQWLHATYEEECAGIPARG